MSVDNHQYDNLKVTKDGHVAVVTFNRPHKANALDHAHLVDIEAAALSFRDDADTRVVIFTGEGKHFSSGADLDGGGPVAANLVERRRLARIGERATLAVYDMDQITIAATDPGRDKPVPYGHSAPWRWVTHAVARIRDAPAFNGSPSVGGGCGTGQARPPQSRATALSGRRGFPCGRPDSRRASRLTDRQASVAAAGRDKPVPYGPAVAARRWPVTPAIVCATRASPPEPG